MTFRKLFIDHERDPNVDAWVEEETQEQEARYTKIEQEMDDMKPERLKWYQQFFDRIQNVGYNTDADDKMPIAPADLPVQPEGREDQVVWKYGIDSDSTGDKNAEQ
jgi:hypothetical protein